jgi:hypothetical protein
MCSSAKAVLASSNPRLANSKTKRSFNELPLCMVNVGREQYVRNKAEQLDHF